jgi:hypothetical protein
VPTDKPVLLTPQKDSEASQRPLEKPSVARKLFAGEEEGLEVDRQSYERFARDLRVASTPVPKVKAQWVNRYLKLLIVGESGKFLMDSYLLVAFLCYVLLLLRRTILAPSIVGSVLSNTSWCLAGLGKTTLIKNLFASYAKVGWSSRFATDLPSLAKALKEHSMDGVYLSKEVLAGGDLYQPSIFVYSSPLSCGLLRAEPGLACP